MKKIIFFLICFRILLANYEIDSNVGLYYTQTYGNYKNDDISLGERKVDYSNLFTNIGINGDKFNYLKYGFNFLGNIKLSGGKSSTSFDIYRDNINTDSILYQSYLGFNNDYFYFSVGRESIDMQWVNNYIQGARFIVKIPNYFELSGIYFDREAIADFHQIIPFEQNKVGQNFVINLSNNLLDILNTNIYFINSNNNINAFNAFGSDFLLHFGIQDYIILDTNLKYTYFDSKLNNLGSTNYFEIKQDVKYNNFESYIGLIKLFGSNNLKILNLVYLSDQTAKNPLQQGNFIYLNNATTAYVGFGYKIEDIFDFNAVYANTNNVKDIDENNQLFKLNSINEINLILGFHLKDFDIDCIYSKVLSNMTMNNKKYNRDYFEGIITYNFNYSN